MKAKEIISETEAKEIDSSNECTVCVLHERAEKVIQPGIKCPSCGYINSTYEFFGSDEVTVYDYTVVGGSNEYRPDENIEKYLVGECSKYGKFIALIPTEIIYNANHDIYYTGSDLYLTKELPDMTDCLIPIIKQYTDRIKSGEKLEPEYLIMWIRYNIEHLIAKYLYDNGFKK